MVPWLLSEGGASVGEIAARFGVAEDEVVRDLQLVGLCGIPPYGGGDLIDVWVDDAGFVHAYPGPFFARPMQLSPAEGFAVLAAGRGLLAVPGADPDGPLARALSKLDDVLGRGALVEVDLADTPHLEAVRTATDRHQRLEVGYYSAWRDDITTRRIDPYLVHTTGGHWYVEAHCHQADGLRRFRLDRLDWVRLTDEVFEARELPLPAEVFAPGPDSRTLVLDVAAAARWAVETAPAGHVEERPDGRLRVELPVAGTAFAERLLLCLGPHAEVVGPPDLADLGRQAATRVLARYRAEPVRR